MYISETNSTNSLLREMLAKGEQVDYIRTGYQSHGRGQAGNGWESEKDKNLLCSIALSTDGVGKEQQFDLNILVSVALHRTVSRLNISGLTIKWPNDLYCRDRKLAGILIESALQGNKIAYAIAGIGLNVNQTEWFSGAPNPTSLALESGREFDVEHLMQDLMDELRAVRRMSREEQRTYYKQHLYRREGFYPYVEREVSTAPTMNAMPAAEGQFMACIKDITPQGEIVLQNEKGETRSYHFKQVRYVI